MSLEQQLALAAETNNLPTVNALLAIPGILVEYRDQYGYSALDWAAKSGHTEIMTALLIAGANPDHSGQHAMRFGPRGAILTGFSSRELASKYNHLEAFNTAFSAFQQAIAPASSSSSYEPIAMRTRSQTAKRDRALVAVETSCSSEVNSQKRPRY